MTKHNDINLLRDSCAMSGGTRDPHILMCMLQSLRSGLLAQEPLATISAAMYNKSFSRVFLPAIAALSIAGCAVGPDYQRPAMDLPKAWPAADKSGTEADKESADWWTLYKDPVLNKLEDEALANNTDVLIAAARIAEARAQLGITDADRYPSISANASANRTQSTLKGSFPLPAGVPRIQNTYEATVNASYEVDLWGKYSRASEAARADLLSAESARDGVRLSLTGQVAKQYFALIATDAQEAVTRRTLETRRETLSLYRKRYDAGTASEYDLRQIEAEEADARSQLANLINGRTRAEGALFLLLGRSPRAIMEDKVVSGKPDGSVELIVPAGLPSDLLLRRPDIVEAEQNLISSNALIGVARADYFPSLGLTAYLGSESVPFSGLFTGPAGIFQFAAAVTQPIWNAGSVSLAVEASEARRDQALAQYRHAVANAFNDVRNALAAQTASLQTLLAEKSRADSLQKALKQANLRYDAGVASRLDVLDVERNLLQAQLAEVDAERARKAALADLFMALGGGWNSKDSKPVTGK